MYYCGLVHEVHAEHRRLTEAQATRVARTRKCTRVHAQRSYITMHIYPFFVLLLVTHGKLDPRPNVVLILADDMGYSDLGWYGSEVRSATANPTLSLLHTLSTPSRAFTRNYC